MKCQNCGNELAQDEVFCGQCGAQQTAPAQPTEMIKQAPRSGLLGSNYSGGSYAPSQPGQSFASENNQSANLQIPQQGGGFYQDATEAFSMAPGQGPGQTNFPQGSYPQQGFQSMPGGYNNNNPGQFGPQPQAQQQPF